VIAAIDKGYVYGQMSKATRGVEAGKAAADDENARTGGGRRIFGLWHGGLGHCRNLLLSSSRCVGME
jgi:hypothetical protein